MNKDQLDNTTAPRSVDGGLFGCPVQHSALWVAGYIREVHGPQRKSTHAADGG